VLDAQLAELSGGVGGAEQDHRVTTPADENRVCRGPRVIWRSGDRVIGKTNPFDIISLQCRRPSNRFRYQGVHA
jgi:hypothetical protein